MNDKDLACWLVKSKADERLSVPEIKMDCNSLLFSSTYHTPFYLVFTCAMNDKNLKYQYKY